MLRNQWEMLMPTLLEQRMNKRIPRAVTEKAPKLLRCKYATEAQLQVPCVLAPSSQVSIPTQRDQQLFPWTSSHCPEALQDQ